MAEAAAALYAVETVVEGAALGAYAVSQSTVPLHVRFREFSVPVQPSSTSSKSIGHTLNIVKGKAYIFGGDINGDNYDDASMIVLTLPSDIENGELDHQLVQPEFETDRPLQAYGSAASTRSEPQSHGSTSVSDHVGQNKQTNDVLSRALHCSTNIDSEIYVLSGRRALAIKSDSSPLGASDSKFYECDHVCAFSTQMNKWSVIKADVEKCVDGIPQSRIGASCTSTPHPQPESAIEVTTHAHGTIFLHGGYDAQGQLLRDTWAFDVNSRRWTRWSDLPNAQPEEVAAEGRIACVDKRLWRAGDGFGKMMYIDFDVVQADVVGQTSGPHRSEVGVKPQGAFWEVLTFGQTATSTALQGEIGGGSEKPSINTAERLPVPRQAAGFLPVTLGAGRQFLLYFMGQDGPGSVLGDVWSFQTESEDKSAAAVKDVIRDAVGRGTGENQWAPCEVIESTKQDGQLHPPRGLTRFATDSWDDLGGGNLILYGGVDASLQPVQQFWVMSVQ